MRPLLISSPHNDHFKNLKQLLEPKGMKKQKRFLVAGLKVISEVQKTRPEIIDTIVMPEGADMSQFEGYRTLVLEKNLFREIDQFGTHQPLLVCQLPDLPLLEGSSQGLEVVLTQGDPSNLGAALRSAVALGAKRVILTKEATSPFHPRALRASSGAWIHAPLFQGPSLLELSDDSDFVVLDMHGEDIHDFRWPERVRVMVGEEGPGVPSQMKGRRVLIPLAPDVESLNATVALSMALFAYRGQHRLR